MNNESRIRVPNAIQPMLANEVDKPFSGKEWVFETKWDGYRAIAVCGEKHTLLYSRNGISFESRYPSLYKALQKFTAPMVIDGEIVALGKDGRSDFQLLQEYEENPDIPLRYYVFDILAYNHKDVSAQPLLYRKALLKKILPASDLVIYCDHAEDDGLGFFEAVRKKNLEGMMAKQKNSQYLPGKRTSLWLKVKNQHTEEAVVLGFTEPRGSRKRFGSLVLGIYKNGKLVYAGHTGTGFTDQLLEELYAKMLPLVNDRSPFEANIKIGQKVTWLRPRLVANIRFTEWTKDGVMRHPVFQGLRIDKTIREMKGS